MKKSKKVIAILLIASIITTSSYKQAKAFDFGLFLTITSCVISTGFKIISKLIEKYSSPKSIDTGTQTYDSYLLNIE